MALNSFNIVIIMNNQVMMLATASFLPCRPILLDLLDHRALHHVAPLHIPGRLDLASHFPLSHCSPAPHFHWILLIIRHRIMLRPFTFLDDWTLLVVFHCPICLLIILCLIFIICIVVIGGIYVHYRVSFIGCRDIHIIIHIGNCIIKKILV
ncbi:hypothetical protein AMTRI_Chr09g37400 [Amborella trichopoda]